MAFDLRSCEMDYQFMLERIDLVEHQMSELSSQFSAYNRKIARQRECGDKLVSSLLSIASNEGLNSTLRFSLAKFSDIIHAIEDYRDVQIRRIDHLVISEFSAYSGNCKQAREQLKLNYDTRAGELIKKKSLDQKKIKKPTNSHQINQAEANRVKAKAAEAAILLFRGIDSFEKKKLEDVKRILMDFIKIQLLFHCKALELYTNAYQTIDKIKPCDDLQEFRQNLRVPSTLDISEMKPPNNGCGDSFQISPTVASARKTSLPFQCETILQDMPSSNCHSSFVSTTTLNSSSESSLTSTISGNNANGRNIIQHFKGLFKPQTKS